ncbi:MAG: alpha/beta hydrolase [Anaerolineaceae bacterium]|nr:alpha/beta hydrolase [Anaerolineaceae bacterium]
MGNKQYRGEVADIDAGVRASVPGNFIQLRGGTTHYELAGPPGAQPVVLVPGFSVPYYLWDHTFDFLVETGFRVLRYDLFGRGYSDRPLDVAYDAGLFDQQLMHLLAVLEIAVPVDLIGSSMGGVVSTIFADRHPEKVRKLTLIDPAGLMGGLSFPNSLLRIPVIGEWLMNWFGTSLLISGNQGDFYAPQAHPEYITQFQPQLHYRGFKNAVLSTLRSGMLSNQVAVFRRVGFQRRPILIIWGREDRVIPYAISQLVCAAMPGAELVGVDQAGHVPHYERPEIVNPLLANFLNVP